MILRGWKRFKGERGQGLVEFALVFPIFLAIVLFIVDVGWITAQRTAFDHGCIYSTWSISADEIGDSDPLEDISSETKYIDGVNEALLANIKTSNIWGLISNNIHVSNATARCYNREESFHVPGRVVSDTEAGVLEASTMTRYMDLSANIRYDIYPITFIGKLFFGESITLEKQYETTKIVRSQSRSG